jgi:hypothetical protein
MTIASAARIAWARLLGREGLCIAGETAEDAWKGRAGPMRGLGNGAMRQARRPAGLWSAKSPGASRGTHWTGVFVKGVS